MRAYDPAGLEQAKRKLEEVTWCADAYEAMDGADAVIILTEWNEFRSLDLGRAKSLLRRPVWVDLRNIYRTGEMEAAGFTYTSVGRAPVGTVG